MRRFGQENISWEVERNEESGMDRVNLEEAAVLAAYETIQQAMILYV